MERHGGRSCSVEFVLCSTYHLALVLKFVEGREEEHSVKYLYL